MGVFSVQRKEWSGKAKRIDEVTKGLPRVGIEGPERHRVVRGQTNVGRTLGNWIGNSQSQDPTSIRATAHGLLTPAHFALSPLADVAAPEPLPARPEGFSQAAFFTAIPHR